MTVNDFLRFVGRSLVATAAALVFFSTTFAVQAQSGAIAVVVGVSEYDDQGYAPLPYALNDARQITKVLEAANFEVTKVYKPDADLPTWQQKNYFEPTKKNVEAALKLAFSPKNPAKTKLFYFSGHGVKGAPRQSTFALKDSQNGDAASCIGAKWIWDLLKNDPAEHKIVIFDACYSGGTRGAPQSAAPAQAATTPFAKGLMKSGDDAYQEDNILTFYSSGVERASKPLNLNAKNVEDMSFFTFWLVEGLKGFADTDGSFTVSTQELEAYVKTNVDALKSNPNYKNVQDPGLHKTESTEHFELVKPKYYTLDETLSNFATQLVAQGDFLRLVSLDLEEFRVAGNLDSDEQPHAKSVANLCAKMLKAKIDEMKPNFETNVPKERPNSETNVPKEHAGGTLRTPTSASSTNSARSVLRSEIRRGQSTDGQDVYFMTSELFVDGNKPKLKLSAIVLADAKQTGEPTETTPIPPRPTNVAPTTTTKTDSSFQANASDDEPPLPPKLEIEFQIEDENGKFQTRSLRWVDGLNWLELNPDEVYKIVLRKFPKTKYAVRVLVDGRNTVAQDEKSANARSSSEKSVSKPATKFEIIPTIAEDSKDKDANDENGQESGSESDEDEEIMPEFVEDEEPGSESDEDENEEPAPQNAETSAVEIAQPPENPQSAQNDVQTTPVDKAKFWVFRNEPNEFELLGFYKAPGTVKNGEDNYHKFTVVSADKLDPQNCSNEMGIITIVYYELLEPGDYGYNKTRNGGPRDVGTRPGKSGRHPINAVTDVQIGRQVDCHRIPYASTKALDEYENQL